MLILENYDLVISRDSKNSDEEVIILVIERQDLPKMDFDPTSVSLIDDVLEGKMLEISFGSGSKSSKVRCINTPQELFDALQKFSNIWFSTVDDGIVVSEHFIPLL